MNYWSGSRTRRDAGQISVDLARVFTLWDRPMPVWLCLTYFVYFGVGGGLTWLVLRRGKRSLAGVKVG